MKRSYSGIKITVLGVLLYVIFAIVLTQCSNEKTTNNEKSYETIPGTGNWPSFRGEYASGVADGQDLPDNWDGKSGKNIKWKTLIPASRQRSAIIVVFLW